ncbi:myelin expression factor 2-like protein [Euroglyphus maynei]|uniref:Myelin expression factor 2-like protein n=1 Tax=Euroglyphus maynei TaxID=6958 RepID=A0A1Y3AXC7_EURMA|nr:myelin expression factor 2-like protein [Euroglyphus maynei]
MDSNSVKVESNQNGEKKNDQNTSNNDLPKNSNDSGRSKDSGRSGGSSRRDRNRSRRRSRSPVRSREDRSTKIHRRVYVANIPFDVKWGELKDLFRDKVGNVRFCQLFENEEGKPRGCGLVEFEDSASAKKAIEVLNRFDFKGRELVVKEDLDIDRDRFGRLILSSGRSDRERDRDRRRDRYEDRHSNGSDSGSSYHTYGLSPQFLNSLGIKGPLTNRVFVANLDYKVSERKLEDIFGLAGKITKVRLYCDNEGKSKGFGVAEFEHPVEAVQAISMFNNQKLYDRILSVRLDKFDNEDSFGKEGLPSKLPRGLESIGKGLGIDGQPLNIAKSIVSSPAPVIQGQSLPGPPPITPQGPNVTPQAATAAINVLSNLAGHFPTLTQSLAQLSNNPGTMAPSASSTGYLPSNTDIAGTGNTVSGAATSGYGHSGYTSVVPHGNGTAQPATYPNASQMMPSSYGTAPPPSTSVPYSANTGTPNAPISSYSTYDQRGDYRDEKYRTSGIDTIFVRNLPPNFSWQNLRDRFNEVGEVRFAEIKGHGTALVRFGSDRDAQRAVDLMNGIRIENRAIEVTLYY